MTAEDLCDWSQHTHFPEAIKYFLGNLEVYGVTRRFTFRFGVYAVVVMNIHRRCLRGLGKWLLVNQHLFVFPYRETSASLHQSCPVLCGRRLRKLWRDYYWHETCIRGSVPLVCLTGLDALGTLLFPSNHRSHRPLRHRT